METELLADNFAGGGGTSEAIKLALGRDPDVAINHDAEALAMHVANHPSTQHFQTNIWRVDPRDVARGRPIGLACFSPDCTHFSKAKGGKPVERRVRDLAWVVVHWAQLVRPRVIMLENVEEFRNWGPLVADRSGKLLPCPDRKGFTFRRWVRELERLGYRVEWRELRACDFGAPTIRKRLFVIARRDGRPIVWPPATHGPGLKPYRTAAEIMDFELPCPSIFLTKEEARAIGCKRPLAPATMARIAKGVFRYVINHADPFIVKFRGGRSAVGLDEPLHTVTANSHIGRPAGAPPFALCCPTLIQTGYGERPGQRPRYLDLHKPLGTVVGGGGRHALVAAFLAQHNGGMVGHDAREAVSTIVNRGPTQALVSSHLISLKGSDRRDSSIDKPAPAICAQGWHVGEVRAFLQKYYGAESGQDQDCREPLHTIATHARFGLVTVAGEQYQIADIGMRMLTPRELFRAQGFRDSYVIDPMCNGKPLTKSAQIRMCGNSVAPPLMAALVGANVPELARERGAAVA